MVNLSLCASNVLNLEIVMANHSIPSDSQSPATANTWQKVSKFLGWPFWTVVVMVGFSVTGYTATSALLSLNTPKGCESVYWPLASGSKRLYCAQVQAEAGNADSLLAAIKLVSNLPEDHPLRKEINKNIKIWSEEVLVLGEKQFQAGNLEAALEIAEKIPSDVVAKSVVQEKVNRWQEIWDQAEAIKAEVEAQLNEAAWNLAFKEAGRLTDIKNEYLANRRYTELVAKIQNAKSEGAVLDEARNAFDRGGVKDLLNAMEKAEQIEQDSYSYKAAQKLITQVGETLMDKAQENLDQRNWRTVLDIAQVVPSERLNLEEKVADLRQIALAGLQANLGTVEGLEQGISQIQDLPEDRPLYGEAQDLITRWKKEINDVQILTIAKQYANGGRTYDLRSAMAKADEIPRGNPRYREAKQLVSQWNRRVQVIEDRPLLNQAARLAQGGSLSDYRSAIAVASEISRDRALYGEAQNRIARWRDQVQRIEDRPLLSQATRLANQGQLKEAIATAQQIGSNRALHGSAQQQIRRWRNELAARDSMKKAYDLAQQQTPDALSQAIEAIRPAQNSGAYRYRAERLVNQWSKQIYAIALRQADQQNLPTAITIAQQVPSQSSVYSEVRGKIQQWKEELISEGED